MDSVNRFDHLAPRNPDAAAILRATERRNPTATAVRGKAPRLSKNSAFGPWDADHPQRQEFRRMLDPGILRNNDKDAVMSLRVLNEITENILKNPDEPKYRRLKTTSDRMNRHIMSRNGTVEFLQKMGFREKTVEFVPMLVFNPERMEDLRTGAKCLEEVMQNQVRAVEDVEHERRQEIANQQAAKTKVRKKIYEDRLAVAARVEREKSARESGDAQTEVNDPEPLVDGMANLKIKTLKDLETPTPQE